MMIGIIPAAGKAERIHGLPKFLLPCADGELLITRLYRAMMLTDLRKTLVRTQYQNFEQVVSYLPNCVVSSVTTLTMTETVMISRPQDNVIFGMPDTFFHDTIAFVKLAAALDDGADLAVGVFHARARQYAQGGMCSVEGDRIIDVIDKPTQQPAGYGWIWGVMAWKPAFWDCLRVDMPHIGYGIMPAIHAGLDVRAVKMDGGFWDCGTPERYFEMIRMTTGQAIHV